MNSKRRLLLAFVVCALMTGLMVEYQPVHAGTILSQVYGPENSSAQVNFGAVAMTTGNILVMVGAGIGTGWVGQGGCNTASIQPPAAELVVNGGPLTVTMQSVSTSWSVANSACTVTMTLTAVATSTGTYTTYAEFAGGYNLISGGATLYVTTGFATQAQAAGGAAGGTTPPQNVMVSNTGPNNGTGNYLSSDYLYFYSSQNVQTYGTMDNVSLYVKAVNINANVGTLYLLFYTAQNQQTTPSAGNPFILNSAYTIAIPVFNGSANFYVHKNPQFAVGPLTWFAVGVMAITTKSDSSTVLGSGISLTMVTDPSSTEYQYNVGSSAPPTSFFSSTQKISSHWDWIYYEILFTVTTQTVTSTTTTGGTATTTVTTTTTNVVNQLNPSSPGFWFLPLLFLLAPMALLIGVKRVATR